jgi:predicted nucleic acid-binding protein
MKGVLVDTQVWVSHLVRPSTRLRGLVEDGIAFMHPYVLCELALGDLGPKRGILLSRLDRMDRVPVIEAEDVFRFIERERLERSGIGFVDAALLASAREGGFRIWTEDKPLRASATRLRLSYEPQRRT